MSSFDDIHQTFKKMSDDMKDDIEDFKHYINKNHKIRKLKIKLDDEIGKINTYYK